MTQLSANVNKIALLRNSRSGRVPDPVVFSEIALEAGAAGITVHPRPDQRHIRPPDVEAIAALLAQGRWKEREFNIEGNPFQGHYMELVRKARPDQCTLVPDDPGQATSDHGWNVAADRERLIPIVNELKQLGCRVSLFMDPDPEQIRRVPETDADRIELYTEQYAVDYAAGGGRREATFQRYAEAAELARELGLGINAGHDLNLENLGPFVSIPGILEVSIGHALTADALQRGMAQAVKDYLTVLAGAKSGV